MRAPSNHIVQTDFENLYTQVRKKEGRWYTDNEVAKLPEIQDSHPHHKEWQMRKCSAHQLTQYLISKGSQLNILEAGCGNGWLIARLAKIISGKATGIDVNPVELEQAKRVFGHIKNLQFLQSDISDGIEAGQQFDIIIFAASIQYFASFRQIIQIALQHLLPGGEIHIMDSHFYKKNETEGARVRSRQYYESIGFSEMSHHYYQHCINEVKQFSFKILYNPNFITYRILRNKNPFYWICIQHP